MTKEMLDLAYALGRKGAEVDARQVAEAMAKGMRLGADSFSKDLQRSQEASKRYVDIAASATRVKFQATTFLDGR
jgi:hypothetical protein